MGKGPKATGLFALIGVESSKELAVCIDKLDKKELNGKILETKKVFTVLISCVDALVKWCHFL